MKGVSSLIGLHLYITDASLKTKNKQTNNGKKKKFMLPLWRFEMTITITKLYLKMVSIPLFV